MFNPSRFRVARKKRRLSKTRLAELMGINLRATVAYESGEYEPSAETAKQLAEVLRFPVAFFSGGDLFEPTIETASFRSLARMSAATRDAALASGSMSMLLSDWMERRFDLPLCTIPDLRGETPEIAATVLRHEWGLGERPIRNMIHLVESKGVRIFSMTEESKDVDAFSVWRDNAPFIFLNTVKSSERSRFDVAHELGHLVLHQQVGAHGKDSEQQANQFASAFLMPRGSILALAPVLPNLRALTELKKQWIVSISALANRLHALQRIKDWHYRSLCIEIAERGYRLNEPEPTPPEMSLILGKVFHSLRAEGVTKADVARDLNYSLEDLEKLIFGLTITALSGGGTSGNRNSVERSIYRIK